MNWLPSNIILLTIHGSQCYGMATESSDVDIKGVCIPPKSIRDNLFHRFDQAENSDFVKKQYSNLINPKNPKLDSVIYGLDKFIKLAAAVNPNIIEILFCDKADYLSLNKAGEKLLKNRDLFISSRAGYTFTGYAAAQMSRIERQRKWLLRPVKNKPTRQEFGLPDKQPKELIEINKYITNEINNLEFKGLGLSDTEHNILQERIWDVLNDINNSSINWGNWREQYKNVAFVKLAKDFNLDKEIIFYLRKEEEYKKAVDNFENYQRWEKDRNPIRKELEIKYKFDCKHASQLVRLLKMGLEILETGKVIVKRPDAQELLFIKNGGWTFEQVQEYAKNMETKIMQILKAKSYKIPHSVNYEKINDLYLNILENA